MTPAAEKPASRACGDTAVEAGRAATQGPWYHFAKRFVRNRTVLDVGCGLAAGLDILRDQAASVTGQDMDSRLARPDVVITPIDRISTKSFDVAVAIDVIEHVEDPDAFLSDLERIARVGIFLSTPNWTASRCRWPYHLREYTPREFHRILCPLGRVVIFKGTANGSLVFRVGHRSAYFIFNDMRVGTVTGFPTRCLNRLLPAALKLYSHNAAYVALP